MATTIGTFTLKGNDLGNGPYYMDLYVNLSNKEYSGFSTSGGLTPDSFTNVLDEYIYLVNQNLTGTITYSLNGPGTWNAGSDTIVTITYTNLFNGPTEVIPNYFVLITESYTYPVVWEAAAPAVPSICNTCQFIQLSQCGTDSFYLDLGLPDGNYTAYYTDNTSGVTWEQGTYSGESGLSMYQWSATEGMFNPYSFYTMTLEDSNGDAVSWTIDGVEYTCATLTFKTTVNITD